MSFNCISVFIVAACLNVVLTSEDNIVEDSELRSNIEKTVGRSYSLTTCDYRAQVGYTCLTCNRALHCYPGNVAILVDCYGLFRFCRDGRCSRFQGDKCFTDNKLTTPDPALNSSIITNVITEATTKQVTEVTEAPTNAATTSNTVGSTKTTTTNPGATTETPAANDDATTKITTANTDATTKTATTEAVATIKITEATNADATTKTATTNAGQTTNTTITIADATTKAVTSNAEAAKTV